MPRLVRRRPLLERLQTMLSPGDFSLWLSEEIETRELDSKKVGTYLGLGLNFTLLVARANSGASAPEDDVFSDEAGSSWLSLFIYPIVWSLVCISLLNALYAFTRTRSYRLFEANVDVRPSTPSARRVKVQSTPTSSASPMRFLADLMTPDSAESRAHPDKSRDVWEISVWDPLPVSLQLVCLFSPGHVLAYLLFLPLAPLDPRPSVTVFCTLVMQGVLTGQLLVLASQFTQQAKDNAIIQKEVMHEYDTKFVHPRLHPVVRDVGTQVTEDQVGRTRDIVQTFTPTTQLRRGFETHPNPNYIDHVDPDHLSNSHLSHLRRTPAASPTAQYSEASRLGLTERKSGMRQSLPATYTPVRTQTPDVGATPGTDLNFGGSMGIHSHHKSPLKKAVSYGDIQQPSSPRNSREMAAYEQGSWGRQSSPTKGTTPLRRSIGIGAGFPTNIRGQNAGVKGYTERYPSRW
ncbi:hypothetical protein B0I35DRAFT_403455 [Stachybotrys elegans]|uniref:Meiotically up-regulated gene 154 protein n=1 Tax=Stachybotrys elegans TaxID=80388 RepID=A0A8K0T6J5_9HYPO|nr:hypothetical protein B0I35DRAFT_403455 [Stachybotrys elegans]